MRIKYNRTSTLQQNGERFNLDKNKYDLVLFDKGVSGKIPFKEREQVEKHLINIVEESQLLEPKRSLSKKMYTIRHSI